MTLGAYQGVPPFAYPGWRLTVPGGPAGGHYKGFTHSYSAGTSIEPGDEYEADRDAGASSHDAVHASPRNPRGVYRSSGEVPPRPNASGAAMTYRGHQTQRHAGTSVSPGSFPADFTESDEDAFLHGLGAAPLLPYQIAANRAGGHYGSAPAPARPNVIMVSAPSAVDTVPVSHLMPAGSPDFVLSQFGVPQPQPVSHMVRVPPGVPGSPQYGVPQPQPTSGATSVVNQPPAQTIPAPPSPSVSVATTPPVSPTPAPVVATNQAVPLNDGSGNYLNVSTGSVVPASSVSQNPATGQYYVASTGVATDPMTWLQENTIWSAVPNWGVLAGGVLLAAMLFKGKR